MKTIVMFLLGCGLLSCSCVNTETIELPRHVEVLEEVGMASSDVSRSEIFGVRVEYNETDSLEKLEELAGVRVGELAFGSPAARSGIRVGDVITAVNGTTVDSPDSFEAALGAVDGEAKIKLDRGTLVIEASAFVPREGEGCRLLHHRDPLKSRGSFRTTSSLDGSLAAEVVEVAHNGPLEDSGIRVGDTIVALDGTRVHSAEQLVRALVESHGYGDRVEVEVERGPSQLKKSLRLWEPERVVSESSLPLLWDYERSVKHDTSQLRLFGFGLYLFTFERSGNEKAYKLLWWTLVKTGYGELIEEEPRG